MAPARRGSGHRVLADREVPARRRSAPGRRIGRVAAALVGGLLGLAVVMAAGPASAAPASPSESAPTATLGCDADARAAGSGVGVAVAFPGRPLFTACVPAGGSGIEVLQRAGLKPVVQGFGSVGGGAVCALTDPRGGEQVGCASGPSCLTCQEPKSWGYYQGYRYSQVGAGATQPASGGIEGWQWGSATSWSATRAYDMCAPTPPPTTTTAPPPTTAPPTTPPGGGSGQANPVPGSPPAGSADPSPGATPDGGGPDAPTDPGGTTSSRPEGSTATTRPEGSTATTRPEGSTTSTTPSTTTPTTTTTTATTTTDPATDPTGDPGRDEEDDGAVTADGDERARGLPDGAMSVSEDDGGGSGALVPVAGTAGVVGLLSVVAIRARRRRAADPPPA